MFSMLALVFGLLLKNTTVMQLALTGLLVLWLSYLVCKANFQRIKIVRKAPSYVYANHEFATVYELQNRKLVFDSFSVEVHDSLIAQYPRTAVASWIRPRRALSVRIPCRILNRGIYVALGYTLRSRFPFGLYEIEAWRVDEVEIIVFPRPSRPEFLASWPAAEFTQTEHDQLLLPTRTGEFRCLREYRPGDPLKGIHWPATARAGALMVREFDPPAPEHFAIVFHSMRPEKRILRIFSFEKSLRILAGLFDYCEEENIPFDFTASFNYWETIRVPDPQDLTEPMISLAGARQQIETESDALIEFLLTLHPSVRVFVVSNTPVRYWSGSLEGLPIDVVCIDNSSVKRIARNLELV
ncbi:MAG: hypothetical protein ACI9TH_004039 [Kiritimatiellia bacterium]|jgi:uncharacterized protein (DUF58 family)